MPSTINGKLAIMELDLDWEPGLPISPGAFDQADQQQLLWGFPEILWGEAELERLPTIFLVGLAQTTIRESGNAQRNVMASENAQRNVMATGDAGVNS